MQDFELSPVERFAADFAEFRFLADRLRMSVAAQRGILAVTESAWEFWCSPGLTGFARPSDAQLRRLSYVLPLMWRMFVNSAAITTAPRRTT